MEAQKGFVSVKDIKVFGFPVARRIVNCSGFSNHPDTQAALGQVEELLKTSSIVFLDAHRKVDKLGLDIFAVAGAAINKLQPHRVVGPVAGAHYSNPLERMFFDAINRADNLTLYPVFRREEREQAERGDENTWFKLSKEEMDRMNDQYDKGLTEALGQTGTIAVIAPFGSRFSYGNPGRIRGGVLKLLRTGVNVVATLAEPQGRIPGLWSKFEVHVSKPLVIAEREPVSNIREIIQSTYRRLEGEAYSSRHR